VTGRPARETRPIGRPLHDIEDRLVARNVSRPLADARQR
jgi:hypothetical protein